jgi:hypothetical protein
MGHFKEFRPLVVYRDLLPVGSTALPALEVVQLKHQGPAADVAETLHQPQLLALDGEGVDPAENLTVLKEPIDAVNW